MSPTLVTFLFEAMNFLVLAAALGWLFFKPVRQALIDRQSKMEAEEKQAADKLAAANQANQEAIAARANLQTELNETRARDLEAARKQAEQLLTDARTSAQRELDSSRKQAFQMAESQRDALATVAAIAAGETVGQLLRQIGGPEIHAALIQSACQQIRLLPPGALAPVKVESAEPLSDQDRAALDQVMSPATNADYRVVKDLGVGVRVSTSQGLIDASTSGLTGFARQALVKEMTKRANNHNPMQANQDA